MLGVRVVTCRPNQKNWLAAIFFAGFGLLWMQVLFQPPRFPSRPDAHTVGISFFFIGSIILTYALFGIAFLLRACVIADDRGLRWRVLGGWKAASWEEVTDYYDLPRQYVRRDQRSTEQNTLKSVQGMAIVTKYNKFQLYSDWTNVSTLREFVTDHATEARVTKWDIIGARVVDK